MRGRGGIYTCVREYGESGGLRAIEDVTAVISTY